MAKIELIRRHAKSYDLILQILEKLSNGMNGCIDFHCDEGKLLFRLATGKSDWHLLGEKEKKSLFRSSDLIRAIDNGNEDVARLIAIDRIINYIRYGKITFHSSYYYQDLGAKIKRVRIGRDEGFLNSDVLEQLISGTFPINIWPLYEAIGFLGRNLRFRDSEAMNIVEVIAQVQVQVQVQAICGDNVKIYSGDCHTTSRVSAGMVFLSHGIVSWLRGGFITSHGSNWKRRGLKDSERTYPF